MKKYLVSGLGPSESGVGRLMRNLTIQAGHEGFTVIARRSKVSIGEMLAQRTFISIALELLYRLFDRFVFFLKILQIKKSLVIFVHPQSAGFGILLRLVKKNKVYLYVMDNSFFCIQSYNLDPEKETECLRCLNTPRSALPGCRPFPIKINRLRNVKYLEDLSLVSKRISFLVQNDSQGDLVKARFGSSVYVKTVGLDTGEIVLHDNEMPLKTTSSISFDLVFHGAPHLAKGLRYFIELSEALSEFTAFIPSSKIECESVIGRRIMAKNITFSDCSWESGLKDAVKTANLVVNPSLWSAPIEGALQKSIHFGRRVVTVESEYGYEKEFIASDTFIRLPRDVSVAAQILRQKFPSAMFSPPSPKEINLNLVKERLNVFKWVSQDEN
ncbi:hypothetical protein BG51_25765 [Pseudomonas [fluorescens] ATCC 17400]|uniref:hypothetical protein n=1 Tax=Pseudomonas proteolytica TaxID=219574 RepID=UPI000AFBBCC7